MKKRFAAFTLLATLLIVAGTTLTVLAQDKPDTLPAHPRYTVLRHLATDNSNTNAKAAAKLPLWKGSYTYERKRYSYTMVGTSPKLGKSTTVPVYIIPVILEYPTATFSPETSQSNGLTAVQNTIASPIFQNMDWISPEGTNLGTTQYEDAFQRGNFWGTVSAKGTYHLLLGAPTLTATQTFSVPAADGQVGTEFGVKVGLADINWIDAKFQSLLTTLKIPVDSLPIFITYNAYLTEGGGCCIGGYHSYTGTQAYSHFTYIGTSGAFSQDVSALSHEAGEWLDDPLTNNTDVPILCAEDGNQSQILEVGDPEEVEAGYGDFPYTLDGFTYHLQDLVYLEYFGAPATTSVDGGAMTFHDNPFGLTVCSNGG
jgi:hypothetical protein